MYRRCDQPFDNCGMIDSICGEFIPTIRMHEYEVWWTDRGTMQIFVNFSDPVALVTCATSNGIFYITHDTGTDSKTIKLKLSDPQVFENVRRKLSQILGIEYNTQAHH